MEKIGLSNYELLSMVNKLIDPDLRKRLPEKYRNSALNALENARDWISPIYDPDDGQNYNELTDELECHNDNLLKLVPADKHKDVCDVLIKYTDCMTNLCTLEKRNFYKIGLRDGFLLAVELLTVQGENKVKNRIDPIDTLDRHRKAL